MVKSIRGRLQAWYALVLLTVIGCFAGVLYYRTRSASLGQIDAQLDSGARLLQVTLRSFPPHELDKSEPDAGPPPERRPPPREFDPQRPPPGQRSRQEIGQGRADGDRSRLPLRAEEFNVPDGPPRDDRAVRDDRPLPGTLEHLLANLDLPSLPALDGEAAGPMYFGVWRADGSVLKTSAEALPDFITDDMKSLKPDGSIRYLGRAGHRLVLLSGPHRTSILVGKPIQREQADLVTFAWQLAGSGAIALALGLVGGWLISARILRPITAISSAAAGISATNLSRRIDTDLLDSELVALAEVLNEMFNRLEAAFERQARFTADASHELRTPLAVVHSHLELALAKPRSADDYRDTLRSCLGASARMRSLVDGLLLLARADAGHLGLDLQRIDLRQVAQEVVRQYLPTAEQHDITLSVTCPAQPAPVMGDGLFLSRVPANLLANALRHTPAGGEVRVSVTIDATQAVLTIADNGSGIPAEDQSRVFERFFRADSARSRASGGSGLGLAICKCLIEAHGGTITFTSQPGCGAEFTIRLPLASSTRQQAALPTPPIPSANLT